MYSCINISNKKKTFLVGDLSFIEDWSYFPYILIRKLCNIILNLGYKI
jgi:hypothetical protein